MFAQDSRDLSLEVLLLGIVAYAVCPVLVIR